MKPLVEYLLKGLSIAQLLGLVIIDQDIKSYSAHCKKPLLAMLGTRYLIREFT